MGNLNEFEFCRIGPTTYPSLIQLMGVVYGRQHDPARLLAKFDTRAFGAENIGYLAFLRSQSSVENSARMPAAFYGVFPLVVRERERDYLAAQSGDTMTHPDFRGRGLFVELATRTYRAAIDDGIEFVFGFPNDNSYPGFAKKLEWVFPYKMLRWVRFVPTLPIGLVRRRLGHRRNELPWHAKWVMRKLFDEVEASNAGLTAVNGDAPEVLHDWRFWKYKEASCMVVRDAGITAVLKFDGDLNLGAVLGKTDRSGLARLMRKLDMLAAATGAIRIRSYFSPHSQMHKLLEGFGTCEPSLWFGSRRFSGDCDTSHMEFSYVDYDTF